MLRLLPTLLALSSWCCLAIPWQTCDSDCHDGVVLSMAHRCHEVEKHDCGCAHEADEVDRDDVGGEGCVSHSSDGAHRSLVFQQGEPEKRPKLPEPESEEESDAPVPAPGFRPAAHVGDAARLSRAQGPPGFERQSVRQLRVTVLLR